MTDGSETIALRKTVIGGQTYDDDFTVMWRPAHRQDHEARRNAVAGRSMVVRLHVLRSTFARQL
jgi:hypothetical protein